MKGIFKVVISIGLSLLFVTCLFLFKILVIIVSVFAIIAVFAVLFYLALFGKRSS